MSETGGSDSLSLEEARQYLTSDTEALIKILDNSKKWLSSDSDESDTAREEAYDLIFSMGEEILAIISHIGKKVDDDQLSLVGAQLAEKCMSIMHNSLVSDDEMALVFSTKLTSLIYPLQPYLNEVTMRKYGASLKRGAEVCKVKLQKTRSGDMKGDMIPVLLTFVGFYASYTYG